MILRQIILMITIVLFFSSCEKWTDPNPDSDPRQDERRYCNDPEAVNYNWGFPGIADSTVCYYPADLFKGSYRFTDSIYSISDVFDSANSHKTYQIEIIPNGKTTLRIAGFCATKNLIFSADRISEIAYADSTYMLNDTTKAYGQPFCRTQDTLSGTITKSTLDSLSHDLQIDWKVISDTGINYHRGTAIKL